MDSFVYLNIFFIFFFSNFGVFFKKKKKIITVSWFCRSVGFYRDYFCHDLSFSSDGSVLSIAYGPVSILYVCWLSGVLCSLFYIVLYLFRDLLYLTFFFYLTQHTILDYHSLGR